MDELVAHGSVPWGSIGQLEWVDPPTAMRYFGVPGNEGLLVTRLLPSGSAARAGLQLGDWILSFNGEKVTDADQLSKLIAQAKIGSRVPIEIRRGNQRGTITVPIESRAQQQVPSRRGR
jgi:serine protease Do